MRNLGQVCAYNAIYLLWRGFPFPNDLRPAPGSPELSYDQLCAALKAAGVNRLRTKLVGWQRPLNTRALSFEPPPAGTFNVWADDLDPNNLAQYRAGQFSGAVPANVWQRSNFGKFVTAAEQHGIKLHAILFDNEEWRSGWDLHAWNANNKYVNGQPCQGDDKGFLNKASDVFTNPGAIAAAKARIDFILKALEGHEDVIGAWEVCAEMSFVCRPSFWGVDGWNAEMIANVRQKMVPWVSTIAQYVKDRHPAPVGNGQVFVGRKKFDPNPNDASRVRNEIFAVPELDFALINWYDGDLASKVRWLRECQRVFDKPVYVEQYAPWELGPAAPYTREAATFPESKAIEWAAACGEYGMVGPMRWPEIRPQGAIQQWWGVAHPNMAEIAGVTSKMAKIVKLDDWSGLGKNFNENITSADLSLKSSWGDGQHVTMFLKWSSGGNKTITLTGLVDQPYKFYLYDWITGDQIGVQDLVATGGKLVLRQVQARDNSMAGYVEGVAHEPTPVAQFRATPRTGELPLTVAFKDESLGRVTSWQWSFGDGATSTEQHPTHTYSNPGVYTVELTVAGPGGQDVEIKADYVVTSEPPQPMIRLVFSDDDPSTEDITVELRAGHTYTVQTSTFEKL